MVKKSNIRSKKPINKKTKVNKTRSKTTRNPQKTITVFLPTKRNRAGYKQPYIPKGYGDASGEYTGTRGHSAIKAIKVKRKLSKNKQTKRKTTSRNYVPKRTQKKAKKSTLKNQITWF